MKLFIILVCIIIVWSCHKSQAEKQQHKANCGCDTDSVINVCVDSTGWLSYDSTFKQYSISDTVQNNFLNVYWVCNPEVKDIALITLTNNQPVEIYYSGKIKMRCSDSLIALPEVFLYNITIDSLKKK